MLQQLQQPLQPGIRYLQLIYPRVDCELKQRRMHRAVIFIIDR